MHELLCALEPGSKVLDLGSGAGSFQGDEYPILVIRADVAYIVKQAGPHAVQADAAMLPFPAESFEAVICNHSLEHFANLDQCIREIGRVLKRRGALFVSVPDARSLTDRLYRLLARGGGHVNAFTDPRDLIQRIEASTHLRHVRTRRLFTSLSFLNRRNFRARAPRSLMLIGNGNETVLAALNLLLRLVDRVFGSRLSRYGWALYFGDVTVGAGAWTNVCVRCGSGHPSESLAAQGLVRRRFVIVPIYRCPRCGAANVYLGDRAA